MEPPTLIIGGLLFGYGMAICGNCGHGALVDWAEGTFVHLLLFWSWEYQLTFSFRTDCWLSTALFNMDLTDPGRHSGFSTYSMNLLAFQVEFLEYLLALLFFFCLSTNLNCIRK